VNAVEAMAWQHSSRRRPVISYCNEHRAIWLNHDWNASVSDFGFKLVGSHVRTEVAGLEFAGSLSTRCGGSRSESRFQLFDVNCYVEKMVAAALNQAIKWAHVSIIPAPGKRHMPGGRDNIVRGVQIDPSFSRTVR